MAGLSRVLLVEDDAHIKEIYSFVLNKNGYTLETATTVEEMLAKVTDFKPEVILLDIMLPGGQTGLDGLKILRKDEKYGCQDVPILLLTNLGENDNIQEIWEKYADGYIIKAEIDPHELKDIIESLEVGHAAS